MPGLRGLGLRCRCRSRGRGVGQRRDGVVDGEGPRWAVGGQRRGRVGRRVATDHRCEGLPQGGRRRVAVRRVLGHRPLQDRLQAGLGRLPRQWRDRVAHDPGDQRDHRLVALHRERRSPRHQRVEGRAERVDVGGHRRCVPVQQLRGGVAERRGDHAGGRLVPTGDPGDAEVDQQRVAVAADHDVGRLDVAVQDPLGVGGVQRPGQRHAELCGRPRVIGHAGAQGVHQAAAGQERHQQVRPPVRGGAGVQHRGDGGVLAELAHRPHLALEPLQRGLVGDAVEHLDRHRPVERRLVGAVHDREPATAHLDRVGDPLDAE